MRPARISLDIYPAGIAPDANPPKAFVGISLNNRVMESVTSLRQIFDWTAEHYGRFDLLIGDYLNRYNYQAFRNEGSATARDRAMRDGVEARERLYPLISPPGPYETAALISTADLCRHPDFSGRFGYFWERYFDNRDFRNLIDEGVDAFLMRKHPSSRHETSARNYCVAYQLEELVIFERLAKDGYNVFVYPGAQLPVMKSLVSGSLGDIAPAIQYLTLVELRLFVEKSR